MPFAVVGASLELVDFVGVGSFGCLAFDFAAAVAPLPSWHLHFDALCAAVPVLVML